MNAAAPEPSGEPLEGRLAVIVDALAVFAVAPARTGLCIEGPACPLREHLVTALEDALAPLSSPWRRLPLGISEDRLLGGLDLTRTLAAGRPVANTGLLAEADGGVVVVPGAELRDGPVVTALSTALDDGVVRLAREGVDGVAAARIGVLALDEGPEPGLPAAWADRLLLRIQLPAISVLGGVLDTLVAPSAEHLRAARARLASVSMPDEAVTIICDAAHKLGVDSLRATTGALVVARVLAALAGSERVTEAELARAAVLVLGPRATRLPERTDPEDLQPEQPPPEDSSAERPEDARSDAPQPPQEPTTDDDERADAELALDALERVLAAASATVPAGLLTGSTKGATVRRGASRSGKAGQRVRGVGRGRPAGVRRARPAPGERLALVETLRAAAPLQALRAPPEGTRGVDGSDGRRPRLRVHADDLRTQRRRSRMPTLTLFVVDASGSAAVQRLAEAKGAVETLLAECYVRRDEVALITFRGERADLLLPPTRSLLRARRSIAALPGGGGTPLASALVLTDRVVADTQARGATPVVVLLTDGRANVCLDGRGDRGEARTQACDVGRRIAARGVRCVVVDTSRRPGAAGRELASALAADYRPLPSGDARAVAALARDASAAPRPPAAA